MLDTVVFFGMVMPAVFNVQLSADEGPGFFSISPEFSSSWQVATLFG